jgi:hypothetical protein
MCSFDFQDWAISNVEIFPTFQQISQFTSSGLMTLGAVLAVVTSLLH